MRFRKVPIAFIAPLGVAAALAAHVSLQAVARLGLGAPEYSAHTHAAVEPALFVEIALALWLAACVVRDALTSRARPVGAIASRPSFSTAGLAFGGSLIALAAIATLFGMEYAESGNAALGLGWLGGDIIPGAIALLTAVMMAVGAFYCIWAGHVAGFDRLVALLAAALARLAATLLAPAASPKTFTTRRLTARSALVARHAGLRAPPTTTR